LASLKVVGVCTYKDGTKYIGNMKEGNKHGVGIEITQEKEERMGVWKNGTLIRWID
jgi:hypothetical protein